MLDDLVDLLGRKQPPGALMPGLTRPAPAPNASSGRGGAAGGSCDGGSDEFRELRFRPPLELGDPSLEPLNLPLQPLVLRRELQQHTHDCLPARVIDRLRLGALHIPTFAAPALCPPDQLNAYSFLFVDRTEPTYRRGGIRVKSRRVQPTARSRKAAVQVPDAVGLPFVVEVAAVA